MNSSSSDTFEQEVREAMKEGDDATPVNVDLISESGSDDVVNDNGFASQTGSDGIQCSLDESDIGTADVLMFKGKIAQLEEKLLQQQEDFIRAQAEAQNIRRRAQKDIENAHKFALDGFINSLLPVVDSLEQGVAMLNADDEGLKPAREGALLTLKMLLDMLAKQHVEPLLPLLMPFNPEQHQAMTMLPTDEHAPNTVINVLQKGYLLHGRVLRPALVVVAKPASPTVKDE